MINQGPCVGNKAGHGRTNVAVNLHDLLDGLGDEEGGGEALFDGEDDAFFGTDADGGGAELDGLEENVVLVATHMCMNKGGDGASSDVRASRAGRSAPRAGYSLASLVLGLPAGPASMRACSSEPPPAVDSSAPPPRSCQ